MKHTSRTTASAGLIVVVLLISHSRDCGAVSPAIRHGAAIAAADGLPTDSPDPGTTSRGGTIARVPSTDRDLLESPVQRLPAVPSIRRKKAGEVVRLFPKGSELPPAQELPVQPHWQVRQPDLGGRETKTGQSLVQATPTVAARLGSAEHRAVVVPTPTPPERILLTGGADEPTLAEPQLVPMPLDQPRPSPPPDRVEDILRQNVLVNPLSGAFDFTESMSANSDGEASMTDVDPQGLGRISLPASLAARVDTIITDATKLADRGAIFAAQREFLRALRMTTRALDTSLGRPYHSQALANGLRALEEADDFSLQPADSVESDLRLANYIKGHRTPILKYDDPASLTPLIALQRYYEYAREQLTLAGGGSPLASKAIYSMGRAEMLQQSQTSKAASGAPRSLALFHAALTIDPNNAPAANELGVMLAGRGRLREAAALLERSVAAEPTPVAVENLATIYEQLGDPRGARWRQDARRVALQTYGAPQISQQPIVWLDPQAFAGTDPDAAQSWPAATAAQDHPSNHQQAGASVAANVQPVAPIGVNGGNVPVASATGQQTGPIARQQDNRRWW